MFRVYSWIFDHRRVKAFALVTAAVLIVHVSVRAQNTIALVSGQACFTDDQVAGASRLLVNGVEADFAQDICYSANIKYLDAKDQVTKEIYFLSNLTDQVTTDGVQLWLNKPSNVYYKGEYDRHYFAYANSKGQVIVRYKDLETDTYSNEVVIQEFTPMDDHLAPAIHVVREGQHKGKIMLAYAYHSSPLYITYSKEAESINDFTTPVEVVSESTTYPNIVETNDVIHVFFRGHPVEVPSSKGLLQKISSGDLLAWTTARTVIEFDEGEFIYHKVSTTAGKEILLGWSVLDREDGAIKDVFFAKSQDGDNWEYFDHAARVWRSQQIIHKEDIEPIYVGEEIRISDVAENHLGYLISFTEFGEEFGCCGLGIDSKIISVTKPVDLITERTVADYYATGIVFDAENPQLFYAMKLDTENNYLLEANLLARDELTVIQSATLLTSKTPIARVSTVEGSETIGNIVYLSIDFYKSYRDFGTSIYKTR